MTKTEFVNKWMPRVFVYQNEFFKDIDLLLPEQSETPKELYQEIYSKGYDDACNQANEERLLISNEQFAKELERRWKNIK